MVLEADLFDIPPSIKLSVFSLVANFDNGLCLLEGAPFAKAEGMGYWFAGLSLGNWLLAGGVIDPL